MVKKCSIKSLRHNYLVQLNHNRSQSGNNYGKYTGVSKGLERMAAGNRLERGVQRLPPLPKEVGYDVCGFAKPSRFIITHDHLDHLPAKTNVTLTCATPLMERLMKRRIYEDVGVEIEEYSGEYFETRHMVSAGRGFVMTPTYGYFLNDVAIIPESINAEELLNEFRLKRVVIVFFKQPRSHMNGVWHPRDLEQVYFADPSSPQKYAPNVVPKCTPSLADIKDMPKVFANNPYAEKFTKQAF